MMDRALLRYMLAVVDHGNFTRAAESCNVTQPTLSQGIARLEALVGQRLFHRTNRRVDVTEAGARLAAHARAIESQFNLAERAVAPVRRRQIVRLGLLATLPDALAQRLAVALAGLADLRIEYVEGRERELSERLASGRIDAALSIQRSAHGYALPLFEEGYGLALPADHVLADRALIAAGDVADNVMIVRRHCELLPQTSQHFTRRGVRPFFAARTTSDARALAYVAAGVGITVMPDCFTAPGVIRRPIAEFEHRRSIALIWREPSEAVEQIGAVAQTLLSPT